MKFTRHSRTCQTSGKLFWTFWQSRRLLNIIQNYLEACKIFQDLSNFRKVILDLLVIYEAFKNHTKIFWSLQDIPGLVKLQENYFGPSGNPGDLKYHTELFWSSRTCQTSGRLCVTFWHSRRLFKIIHNYLEVMKVILDLQQSMRLLKIIQKHSRHCKTFQYFRKVILDLLEIQETFKNILKLARHSRTSQTSEKLFWT